MASTDEGESSVTFTIPILLLGALLGWYLSQWASRREPSALKFNNEMLLDFNEKLISSRDIAERQMKISDGIVEAYCQHLETHACVVKEEWPEVVG